MMHAFAVPKAFVSFLSMPIPFYFSYIDSGHSPVIKVCCLPTLSDSGNSPVVHMHVAWQPPFSFLSIIAPHPSLYSIIAPPLLL